MNDYFFLYTLISVKVPGSGLALARPLREVPGEARHTPAPHDVDARVNTTPTLPLNIRDLKNGDILDYIVFYNEDFNANSSLVSCMKS